MNDRVSLNDGYEGTHARFKNSGNEADAVGNVSSKQASADFEGPNKGAFAKAGQSGSQALASTFAATGSMHSSDAARGVKFINQTAGHEGDAADETHTVSTSAADHASGIQGKIIPS